MSERETFVYTIQTLSGDEYRVSRSVERLLESGEIADKYIPMREFPRKIKGRWTKRVERLFPGYLFVETPDPERLFFRLKEIPGLTRILADRENTFYRLTEGEARYIRKIGAPRKDHVFGMSRVMVDDSDPALRPGERVRVVSGDLLDFQGDIIRYDLHHRKVYLRTDMFGGTEISVGIELIHKV